MQIGSTIVLRPSSTQHEVLQDFDIVQKHPVVAHHDECPAITVSAFTGSLVRVGFSLGLVLGAGCVLGRTVGCEELQHS